MLGLTKFSADLMIMLGLTVKLMALNVRGLEKSR
jgi:hypothetical protein